MLQLLQARRRSAGKDVNQSVVTSASHRRLPLQEYALLNEGLRARNRKGIRWRCMWIFIKVKSPGEVVNQQPFVISTEGYVAAAESHSKYCT